jgi:aminotransferase
MINIFSNTLGTEELAAIEQAFTSRWVGRGKQCAAFEGELAQHLGVDDVLLFNSCTSATFAAIKALGIGPGDEVLMPSVQFLGVANAVIDAGAHPVFCDVNRRTLNILPSEIHDCRTSRTKAVFILHYGGHPAPIASIKDAGHGLLILEDAANAPASKWMGKACGTLGDAGVWSFDAMKILVMCDGGALWMRDKDAWHRAYNRRYFGLPPKDNSGIDASRDRASRWWEFDLEAFNGRHTSNDVLASVGRVQLGKLAGFVETRRAIWDRYQLELAGIPGLDRPPEVMPGCEGSYYLYWVQTERRDELARHLLDNGIYTTFRYYPLHLVPAYKARTHLPNAEYVSERTLCLPLHQNLTDHDVEHIISSVRGFFRS